MTTHVKDPDMTTSDTLATVWAPRVLSILRIIVAFLYIAHGTQKLFGLPGAGTAPPFDLMTLRGASAILETFGGALLLVGLFTRPVAFILSGHMAFAYFLSHAPLAPSFRNRVKHTNCRVPAASGPSHSKPESTHQCRAL